MSIVIKQFALGHFASWVGERLGLEERNRNLISCKKFVCTKVGGG